jgi:sortase B
LRESWYKNSDNQVIVFNTPDKQLRFKIFSIYVVDNTTDYLSINFNEEEFVNFINLIKGRSIYDFGEQVIYGDKIITLSTCSDRGDKRLVVHAKLI